MRHTFPCSVSAATETRKGSSDHCRTKSTRTGEDGMKPSKRMTTFYELTQQEKDALCQVSMPTHDVNIKNSGSEAPLSSEPNIVGSVRSVGQSNPRRLPSQKGADIVLEHPDIAKMAISLEQYTTMYQGLPQKPAVTVQDGSRQLVEGRDYTVHYVNNIDPGKATVLIEGHGTYTGKASVFFTITPKPTARPQTAKKRPWVLVLVAIVLAGTLGGMIIWNIRKPAEEVTAPLPSSDETTSLHSENQTASLVSVQESSKKSSSDKESSEKQSSTKESSQKETSSKESSAKESSTIESSAEESFASEASEEPTESVSVVSVVVPPSTPSVISQLQPSVRSTVPSSSIAESSEEDSHFRAGAEDDKILTSLTLVQKPAKTQYQTGEAFDLSGLVLRAEYMDGSQETVGADDCLYGEADTSSAGKKTVTVGYGGKTISLVIEVVGETSPAEETRTGTCGTSLTYELTADGTLTIQGKGTMSDGNSLPFMGDESIRKVILKDGVTSVGAQTFYDCHSLTSVQMADSITEIGGYAFADCIKLRDLTLSSSLTDIDYCAFSNCIALQSVDFPDTLLFIGDNAFSDCSHLEKAVIPSSVDFIDDSAFYNCPRLTIFGEVGSEADTFAQSHSITFKSLS